MNRCEVCLEQAEIECDKTYFCEKCYEIIYNTQ